MQGNAKCKQICASLLLAGYMLPSNASSLMELYGLAMESNPTLKRRELEVGLSEAQVDLAMSRLFPQIAVDISRSPQVTFTDERTGFKQRYDGTRKSIQLRQALFDISTWYRARSEDGHIRQAAAALDAARMLIAGDLVDRYLSALQAQDEIARLRAEKTAVDVQIKKLRKMRELQMAKVTDLLAAEAYFESLESQAIDAGAAYAVAMAKLQEICGIPVEKIDGLGSVAQKEQDRSDEEWLETALSSNPQILALRHSISAAQDMIASSKAQHLPTVSLVASKLYADQGYDNRLQPPYAVNTVMIQVSMPILEGGRVNASARDSVMRRDIANQQLEEGVREVTRQVLGDLVHAKASRARIEATAREAQVQEQYLDAQEKGNLLGATTVIDVLDARRRLLKARGATDSARYDLVRDLSALQIHAGKLDAGSMKTISGWFSGVASRGLDERVPGRQ
jgi:outer membrane protein